MNICAAGHDEIIYEGMPCPLCESISATEDAETKITDLEEEIEKLTSDAAECMT